MPWRIMTALVLVVLAVATATACGRDESSSSGPARPTLAPGEDLSLERDDCVAPDVSRGADSWHEVACDDPVAAGRVTERREDVPGLAGMLATSDCPAESDVALDVRRFLMKNTARGFACVRNLQPPHPGDPGEGGGAGITLGDCVALEAGDVEETRCDGTGALAPEHHVTHIGIGLCPLGSDLSFSVGRGPGAALAVREVICAEALSPEAAAEAASQAPSDPGSPPVPTPAPFGIPTPTLSPDALDKVLEDPGSGP